mgnify:CR=1 FL=1
MRLLLCISYYYLVSQMSKRNPMKTTETKRCWWCGDDPLYQSYHDNEWGVPVHNDRDLFEFLCLEGAQAGLSWITILRKREHYRLVFDGFDAEKIARYDDAKIAALLGDAGIVRNRLKVNGFVKNAKAYLAMLECMDNAVGKVLDTLEKTGPLENTMVARSS